MTRLLNQYFTMIPIVIQLTTSFSMKSLIIIDIFYELCSLSLLPAWVFSGWPPLRQSKGLKKSVFVRL
jgi:hypothetical protein